MKSKIFVTLLITLTIAVPVVQSCIPNTGAKKPKWAEKKNLNDTRHLRRKYDKCRGIDNGRYQKRAFGAAILSLQEGKWILEEINSESMWISAKKCYRDNPKYCAIINFYTTAAGILETNPRRVQKKLEDDVERWLTNFDQIYSKYRCYTDDALSEEMNKYGLTF